MHRVELKARSTFTGPFSPWAFLMHRVELKVVIVDGDRHMP